MGQCQYRYKDQEQCIIKNLPPGKIMCPDHVLITQMAKDDAKYYQRHKKRIEENRPSRAKPKVEKVDEKSKEDNPIYYDHTAPWRCGQSGCESCKNKPSYDDWVRSKNVTTR